MKKNISLSFLVLFSVSFLFMKCTKSPDDNLPAEPVQIELTSAPSGPAVFRADHPFIYAIRETSTNSVIFMGLLADPLAE